MLAENSNTSVIVWSLVLVAVVIAGFVVVTWVKKRVTKQDEPVSTGFTLSDLRRLHKEGKLSAEEFERAKGAVTAGAKASLQRKNPVKPGGPAAGGSHIDPGV